MHCFFETVTARKGQKIAHMDCGADYIDVVTSRKIHSFLNGSLILSSRNKEEFLTCTVPVIPMVVGSLSPERMTISRDDTYADMLDKLIDTISKSRKMKMVVLESKPDEMEENKPKQLSPSPSFFPVLAYKGQLQKISEDTEETLSNSDILLKTRFPKSMWGAKEVGKVLSKIRTAFESISETVEDFEAAIEVSDKKAGVLDSLSKNKNVKDEFKVEVMSSIIENFFIIKKMLSRIIHDFYRLYDIGEVFKKQTGYPPTWFFDSSVFYDFQYGFENLIRHLVRMAKADATLIEPLYDLKVKLTGE